MLYEAEAEIAFAIIPSYVKVPVIKSPIHVYFFLPQKTSPQRMPRISCFIGKYFLGYLLMLSA
jgi:hypothetical protein